MKVSIESRVNLVIDVLVEDKKYRFEAEANSPLAYAREAGVRFVAEIDRQILAGQEAESAAAKAKAGQEAATEKKEYDVKASREENEG